MTYTSAKPGVANHRLKFKFPQMIPLNGQLYKNQNNKIKIYICIEFTLQINSLNFPLYKSIKRSYFCE